MSKHARLRQLLHGYEIGEATPEQVAELSAMIKADPAAARAAAQWMLMTSDVSETMSKRRAATTQASRPHLKLALALAGTAAAVLLTACGLAVYLLTTSVDPKPDPVDPNQPGPSVATLIENTGDLRTPGDFAIEGENYSAGEYSLSGGTAEFMLTNAVNVKLRGDTRMVMRNNMNVSLTRGSAAFVVPKDAEGFTVHLTDGSKIVDLGTAFNVEIDDGDGTQLRVTEGAVRYEHPIYEDAILHARYGLHITRDGLAYGIDTAGTVETTFVEHPLREPADIANDGVLVEANNIGASDRAGGVGATPPPALNVNGIAFGNDRSAIVGDLAFAGTYVPTTLADPDLSTLMASLAGVNAPGQLRLRFDDLRPGQTYRLQLLVMLGSNDRTFVFDALDQTAKFEIAASKTQGHVITLTFTADSDQLKLGIKGQKIQSPDFAPFINAYVLHKIDP